MRSDVACGSQAVPLPNSGSCAPRARRKDLQTVGETPNRYRTIQPKRR